MNHPTKTARKSAIGAGLVAIGLAALLLSGCGSESTPGGDASSTTSVPAPAPTNTPVSVPAWTPPISSTSLMVDASTPEVVSYGSDPAQTLEVFQSSGDPMGTIIYIHGGAWEGGSAQANTSAIILNEEEQEKAAEFRQLSSESATNTGDRLKKQLGRGWDVVSINYRLATSTAGPGVRAAQILNDVDHAMRYTVANASKLGLDMHKLVLSGGSAGGHLALMEALTSSTGQFTDPALPANLKSVKVAFDGVIAMVAPSDLNTLYKAGGVAPIGEEALLGCSYQNTPAITSMPPCAPSLADQFSPIVYTKAAAANGTKLPPAYFAYGGQDTLVINATQGQPEVTAWADAAGPDQTWYDFPPTGTHNIDDNVNELALNYWLDNVESGKWTGPGAEQPSN
jgi:acetyl esterase/lipase